MLLGLCCAFCGSFLFPCCGDRECQDDCGADQLQSFEGRIKEDQIEEEGVDDLRVEEHANSARIHGLVEACDNGLLDPMAETRSNKFNPGKLSHEVKHVVFHTQDEDPNRARDECCQDEVELNHAEMAVL